MVNLSNLKQKEIRKEITIDINGELQEINIFNPSAEYRVGLKEKINELMGQNLEGMALVEEIFTDVISEVTNIVINEDVIEVLNRPTADMLVVMQEVYDIINEISIECMMDSYQQLCQIEMVSYSKMNLLKAQKIELLEKKNKELEKEINEITNESVSNGGNELI